MSKREVRMIRLSLIISAALLSLGAQDTARMKQAIEPAPLRKDVKLRTRAAAQGASQTAPAVNMEVLAKDFSVNAGASASFTANSDFSGSQAVSIAISAPSSQDLGAVRLLVWWAIPGVDFYVLQDVIVGTNFYFSNQGGGIVPAYGNQLQVQVMNDGASPITFHQLTAYSVIR
jgi:hypothetical protein